MSQSSIEIARTILGQIGSNTLMCIGFPRGSAVALNETSERSGGVEFKFTNCPKVRNGKVRVSLLWNDTYKVEIMNQRGTIVHESDGVYNDQLSGPNGIIEQVVG